MWRNNFVGVVTTVVLAALGTLYNFMTNGGLAPTLGAITRATLKEELKNIGITPDGPAGNVPSGTIAFCGKESDSETVWIRPDQGGRKRDYGEYGGVFGSAEVRIGPPLLGNGESLASGTNAPYVQLLACRKT